MAFDDAGSERRMRVLAVVAIFLLAGCAGAPDEPDEESLWGTCPQWVYGAPQAFNATGADLCIDLNVTEQDGRPLDLYTLELHVTGDLRVRAYDADGGRLPFRVYTPDPDARPTLDLHDEVLEVEVYLTPVAHGSAPAPGPLRLALEGDGGLNVTALPGFRVCGEPV